MIVPKPAGIRRIKRNGIHLEVVGREIRILQAKLDGLDGTVPQGRACLLDRLGLIRVDETHLRNICVYVKNSQIGAGHVKSLADAIDGVDEPLVVEVVLALDKTAEFNQQITCGIKSCIFSKSAIV